LLDPGGGPRSSLSSHRTTPFPGRDRRCTRGQGVTQVE
jgi:hypothetical protein